MTQQSTTASQDTNAANDRLRALLELHFHPEWGSTYWLQRQERLGWSVCDRVRTLEDLWLLGPMPADDLRRLSVRALIPRGLQQQLPRFVLGETAGTSGVPSVTAYRDDEFQEAFISPFLRVTESVAFPRQVPWLWVGPSGPHIIGKVVRELARQTGSMDPFSVDFDPRWAKRLANGSTARQRYLDHVTDQAIDVMRREEIGVLFITPPALAALAMRLSDQQREAIRGIHYGGMSLDPETVNDFRAAFPYAIHLAGYGNTLFGVVMEVTDTHREAMDYYPLADRVVFHVVDGALDDNGEGTWPPRLCEQGQVGRVLFHRLDESCLLIGRLERDQAERVSPSKEALALGGRADGIRNPKAPTGMLGKLQMGLY